QDHRQIWFAFLYGFALLSIIQFPTVTGDCWLIEGEKGFVWLAICSQNQPPYEAIPAHINSTIVDLRLNENKIKSIHFSSLSRFGNLTYLNLTKNEISYVEDGAFSAQFNLQVLQLGFNRLRNLTEGILRGLGKLQYLYLQANLIEAVTPNTFEECPNIENIDLSMNRIQVLDGGLFTGLSRLTTCELYTNPFNCSCELLGFLLEVCTDDGSNSLPSIIVQSDFTTLPPYSPCGLDDCPSGMSPEDPISISPSYLDVNNKPSMKVKQISHTSAVIMVQIPHPFSKMYILVLYNNSFFTDIQNLKNHKEEIELNNLKAHTDYTYCVVSIRHQLRYNHTCLSISTGRKAGLERTSNDSSATHYIMTILGSLFSMVLILGFVFHCLRKKRQRDEKNKKIGKIQKSLMELKYGADLEGGGGTGGGGSISQLSQKQMLSAGESLTRMPYLPQGGTCEMDQYDLQEIIDTPKAAKGNYIEVRGTRDRERECSLSPQDNPQGSVAEISTIASEVDKVNQIINNCIDVLKSESTSFQGVKSGSVSTAEPQLELISDQPQRQSGFLSPQYKGYHHPLQRHHSMEAPSKRPSTSSSGSVRSPRTFRSDGPYRGTSETKYIEKTSPTGTTENTVLTVTPAAAILRAEAQRVRQYKEQRHSYPGPQHHLPDSEELEELSSRKPSSILEPLTLGRHPRELAYAQLSPQYHNLSYESSPEYSCTPSLGIWERFKLHRKRHRDEDYEEEYMAAGHALRRSLQVAKDEDLHDILDYWKGVSAQQKS
uniref:Extracellular leucine rich repeat and fibronectin type III domain containing 1 n=1 Tax=Salmo trutta TaxID=8032 RepID=A0A674E347_SALTR